MNTGPKTVELLRQVPLFRHLNRIERETLSWIVTMRNKRKGTVIYEENQPRHSVYFILSGLVKTYRKNSEGSERICSYLKKRDILPFPGMPDPTPYAETAETIVQTSVLKMSLAVFEQYLKKLPAAEQKIRRALAEIAEERRADRPETFMEDADIRGKSFLLQLAEHAGLTAGGKIRIGIPMTNEFFAHTIGASKETGDRFLHRMHEEGIADMSRTGFVIHNVEALRHWGNEWTIHADRESG